MFLLVVGVAGLVYYYSKRPPATKPKGTVEILPAEKPLKPPVKATSDVELEITIEKVQKGSQKGSEGQGDEKDKFRDSP